MKKIILLTLGLLLLSAGITNIPKPKEVKAEAYTQTYSFQTHFERYWSENFNISDFHHLKFEEKTTIETTTEITTETTTVTTTTQAAQSAMEDLGEFRISHYCPCAACNGGSTKTALGTPITAYYTIAVDPKIIPLGTKVSIDGNTYVAQDTGGAIKGNKIDLCVGSHSEAYDRGIRYTHVYIVK